MKPICLLSILLAFVLTSAQSFAWQPAKDCRANIARVTCRVAALTKEQDRDPRIPRVCLGGEKPYADELLKVHDELPPKLKKMFCHLRRIYIEEEFYASAYAQKFAEAFTGKDGKVRVKYSGNILGLSRKKIFDSKYNLSEWLNRKEQTFFGRKMDDPISPLMPEFFLQYSGLKAKPLLVETVIHEFGHLLDKANSINLMLRPEGAKCEALENEDLPECRPVPHGLWSSISWLADGSIRTEDRYFGEYRPCYYGCDKTKTAPLEKAAEIYRSFIDGNAFVSVYASVDPFEDFAESFTHYVSDRYFSPEKQTKKLFYAAVKLPGGEFEYLNVRKYRGRILAKMNFMAMFDAMPWKYELDDGGSMSLEDYAKAAPPEPSPVP